MSLAPGFFRTLSRLFLIVSWTAFLAALEVVAAQAQPRAEIPETVHNFGQVRDDMTLSHTFEVKNTGNRELRILEVDPDCVCTVANYDRVIPPGGTGKVTLELKPYSVGRAFNKKTLIRFNAPNQPSVNLVLKGEAQKSIEIVPSHIIRLQGGPSANPTAQVRLISNLPFPWEITKVQNSNPDQIDATLKTEKPGKVYVLEVRSKYRDQGHYVSTIELYTNAIHRPKIVMRVIADLKAGPAVIP
uniref:DUF1573 domain-containing protein n=1 Tax=Desulfobacca acetoxidans TaxID=60893 RepID=A0A7C3Z1D1_9BACT